MKKYTTDEVLAHTTVDPNVLRRLVDIGVIQPDVAAKVGRGRPRLYSFRNLVEVMVAQQMSALRVQTATIRALLKGLRAQDDQSRRNDTAARWRLFRDPRTRPPDWVAVLDVVLTEEAPNFGALLFVDQPTKLPRGQPADPRIMVSFTVYIGHILHLLEHRTGGDHWELSAKERRLQQADPEYLVRLNLPADEETRIAAERASGLLAGEAAIVNRMPPAEQLAFRQRREAERLDAQLREELRLPAVDYRRPVRGPDGIPKKRNLLTRKDAKRLKRER
jgi:DNA-binding transcriptional MerR regulator